MKNKSIRTALIALLVTFASACALAHPDVDGTGGALHVADNGRFLITVSDYGRGIAGIRAAGGAVALELPAHGLIAAVLPDGAIAALRRNPNIVRIEQDQIRRPMAEPAPWGIRRVQADSVVIPTFSPAEPIKMVCIIDGGYYREHADLSGNTVTGSPSDGECAHGTHVAGTIAATGGNGTGVVGVLPDGVPIHVVQVFGGTDCGWTYSSNLIAAVQECLDAEADVINMSLGGGGASGPEEAIFIKAFGLGVLSFAAAGNDGDDDSDAVATALSYPASYASVISIGATNIADDRADFSQYNAQVELSAPGESVLSTVPYIATNSLETASETFAGGSMEGSIEGEVTGPLANGFDCNSRPRRNAFAGKIVLCQRGGDTFRKKVENAVRGGAIGVLVYNNEAGALSATLGGGRTLGVPIATLSDTQGADAIADVGQNATLTVSMERPVSGGPPVNGYDTFSGTSMATPHAAGVAALVWSAAPGASAQEVRTALIATADDLNGGGRDDEFGHGLVQAYDAVTYLLASVPEAYNCVPTAGQEVVETSCDGDGVDDDCDGDVDTDDSDCPDIGDGGDPPPPPTCDLGDPGDSCRANAACCSGICRGRGGSKTCR
ncbi:MAG: S8 family serine peptidase [Deltaproteobacteria bacterium]|nr:S8 family serine peptidase [Deltaproteobacteria bacterium]